MDDEILQLLSGYEALYRRMTGKPGASFQTEASHDGAPHVEFRDGKYLYITTERGLEISRKETADGREMLYWMLSDIAFWMGVKFEFENRIESLDCRRMIFPEQLRLLERADPEFSKRRKKEIEKTLTENPFIDKGA